MARALTAPGAQADATADNSIAADKNHLQADDLVLIGSPGAGSAKTVKDYDPQLANGHVWAGSASKDLVTWLNGNNLIATGNYGGVERAQARHAKWEFPKGHVVKDPEADRRV